MAAPEKTAPKHEAPKHETPKHEAVVEPLALSGGVLVPLTPLNTLEPVYWQVTNGVTGGELVRGQPGLPIVQQTSEFIATAAQLAALHANPLQIIAAPGLGFALVPIFFNFILRYAAPTYVETGSDGNLYVGWGDTAAKVVAAPALELSVPDLVCSSQSVMIVQPCNMPSPVQLRQIDNQPLTLAILDSLSAGGGHLHFIVEYAIVATAL